MRVRVEISPAVAWPVLRGVTVGNGAVSDLSGTKTLVQSHGSSVGATAPATITSGTPTAAIPYLALT